MNIKIGAIIKKLRTENNTTQDSLATAVGVTPQAISRWEAENGYPDIELLPAIADFFSVTTDELLGYKLSEREEKLAEIKKELDRLSEVGSIKKRINYAQVALTHYPSDCNIKEHLAVCLYCQWCDTKNDSLLPEAESIALSVVNDCKDEEQRYDAINLLINIYSDTKRPADALKMTELLTPMKYCREFAKSSGLGDGKTEYYKQDEIDKLTDCLGLAIRNLVLDDELPNDPSTWDKKIRMLQTANELYSMIYGENLMFYHNRLMWNYQIMSTYQTAQGKTGDALDSPEKACEHAVQYDISYQNDHGKAYTSIFTDKLVYPYPSKDFHELSEHSSSYYLLDRLKESRYDSIRDDERFAEIERKLKKYAR